MSSRKPLAVGEWYHCFNRGVDKRKIFFTVKDYERFLMLMYVANNSKPVHLSNLKHKGLNLRNVFEEGFLDRGEPLVEIGAYALMPNHFHMVVKETQENGITSFMQKISTAYTMYFNKKNDRTGTLMAGPFKSKHVPDDGYFKQLVSYVHLNPIELFEPKWKEDIGNVSRIEKQLLKYEYSSLLDFTGKKRSQKKILATAVFSLYDTVPLTRAVIKETQLFYTEQRIIKASP